MPIYEYQCSGCGKINEFLVKSARSTKLTCPDCGSKKLKKRFSSFAVGVSQAGDSSKCLTCTDRGCPHASG